MLREVDPPLHTRKRKESLLQRSLAYIDGQFSTSSGTVLDANLGSFRIRCPSSASKDSSKFNSEELSTHISEPYSRTGRMQLSMMLHDDRGLR